MTMMVAALDPRVRVAVISGALNVFQERVQGAGFSCGAQVIPGLLEFGDTPEIGSLIAPRPVIWEAGRQDALMVPGWLEKASARIQRAYAVAGRPENFEVHRFDGGHVWHGETAIPLLARLLKEQRKATGVPNGGIWRSPHPRRNAAGRAVIDISRDGRGCGIILWLNR
jgi:hypothetical protein